MIQLPRASSVNGNSESYGLRAVSAAGSLAGSASSGITVSEFARHAVGTKRRAVDLTGDDDNDDHDDDENEEEKKGSEASKDESYMARVMAQSRQRKRQRVAQVVLDESDDDDEDGDEVGCGVVVVETGWGAAVLYLCSARLWTYCSNGCA